MAVTDAKDLGKRMKNDDDYLELEGDLARKVLKIKAKGKVAIGAAVAIVAGILAAVVITAGSGGTSIPLTAPIGAAEYAALIPIVGSLDLATVIVAIAIGGGNAAILHKLFDYDITKIDDDHIILKKK
jgi:hypothetical protein